MKILFSMLLLTMVACGQDRAGDTGGEAGSSSGTPIIYSVNYPLYWMAEQLAADDARVVFPAPAAVDPAFWKPDTATLSGYQQADLVLLNGADYAKWVSRVSLPASRLVDTSAAYKDRLLPLDSGPVHSHGPEGDHSHGEVAFTTWLDLELAGAQAKAVAAALRQLLPQSAAIEQRLEALLQQLDSMDARMTSLGAVLDDAPILYSHPVYQYLQQRYQLNGRSLHWEPDIVPDESEWRGLADLLKRHPARIMLWEDQPLPEVQARLKDFGVQVVVFSPMGNRPSRGDFATNMAASIAALTRAAEG